MALNRGIAEAAEAVVEKLEKLAKPMDITKTDDIVNVASISANNDREIGKIMAEAFQKVGKDGVITVEEGKSFETTVEVVEGMQFDRGYLSPALRHRPGQDGLRAGEALHPRPRGQDRQHRQARAAARRSRQGQAPLLIIAEDVEGEALATLVVNKLKGMLQRGGREGPRLRRSPQGHARGYRDPDRRRGHLQGPGHRAGERLHVSQLGQAKKITIDNDNTTIIEGAGSQAAIKGRIKQIKARSKSPPATTTARSSRSGWPSWPAASRRSTSAPPPKRK